MFVGIKCLCSVSRSVGGLCFVRSSVGGLCSVRRSVGGLGFVRGSVGCLCLLLISGKKKREEGGGGPLCSSGGYRVKALLLVKQSNHFRRVMNVTLNETFDTGVVNIIPYLRSLRPNPQVQKL